MKTLYFLNRGDILNEDFTVPIKPKRSDWYTEVNPTRLVRSFEFESYDNLMFFVTNLMRYADKIDHHPNIQINGSESVLVETYTHSINDVSSQDTRLVKIADQIYKDSTYVDDKEEENQENVDNDERLTERYRFDWTADW